MNIVAIPSWNVVGVIPPVQPGAPIGSNRSPYAVALIDVVSRFGTSPERRRILDGLLRLRRALHEAGLVSGFQWLNGSFVEEIEVLESRSPVDIDVVTFVDPPTGFTMSEEVLGRLEHDPVKTEFHVDHYFVELNLPSRVLVAQAAYWYSVWSHRRSQLWKGYLQIDLNSSEDDTARANLALADAQEAQS